MFEPSELYLVLMFKVDEICLLAAGDRSILRDLPGWLLYLSFIRRPRCFCVSFLSGAGLSCLFTAKSMV